MEVSTINLLLIVERQVGEVKYEHRFTVEGHPGVVNWLESGLGDGGGAR
jgi:hypothetical protein